MGAYYLGPILGPLIFGNSHIPCTIYHIPYALYYTIYHTRTPDFWRQPCCARWVAVQKFNSNYHDMDIYQIILLLNYGDLLYIPEQ